MPNIAFWQNRRVALTGATGFVGHHVAMQLVQAGAKVRAVARPTSRTARLTKVGVECRRTELDDASQLQAAFTDVEIVFHIAGAVDFESDWERFLEVNVRGTQRVLEAAQAAGVRRVVFTSSIVAIGAGARPKELDESATWNLEALRVPYITTKRWAEDAALAFPDLEVVVVNPASVVGPDDFTGSEFGTLCKRFWKGRIPFHFGGGNNFVDVRDVAAGHLLAAEKGRAGDRYILGGENLTYAHFFAALARSAGRWVPRLPLPQAVGHVIAYLNSAWPRAAKQRAYLTPAQARVLSRYFFVSSAKARRELGYEPRPLESSLHDAHNFWIHRRCA